MSAGTGREPSGGKVFRKFSLLSGRVFNMQMGARHRAFPRGPDVGGVRVALPAARPPLAGNWFWSGCISIIVCLCVSVHIHLCVSVCVSRSVVSDSLQPPGL